MEFHIPQSSEMGTPQSDGLVSYPDTPCVWESYPSVEMQSVYSTDPVNWAENLLGCDYLWDILYIQQFDEIILNISNLCNCVPIIFSYRQHI